MYLLLAVSCKAPPDAPKTLDKLTGYLYTHVMDEEPEELQAGLQNLRIWVDAHLEETQEGYSVENLSQDAVDNLDACKRNLDGLLGAAVGTENRHKIEDVVRVYILVDPRDIYGDDLISYSRDYQDDPECFASQECDILRYEARSTRKYPLGITGTSRNQVQHRWVETEDGLHHISRSWMKRPAHLTTDLFAVKQQFYMNVTMPWPGGKTVRMQSTWAVIKILAGNFPENLARNLVIDTMSKDDELIEAYLDAH